MLEKQKTSLLLVLLCIFSLSGCSTFGGGDGFDEDKIGEMPAEALYEQANAEFEDGNYAEATKLFEELERQHPYSELASKSELMAAFSSYKDSRYDEAILTLDRFVELHPGHKDVDYALYLRALCFYEQISDVARDQGFTKEALNALELLIFRFPDSQYTRDAEYKRDLTLDHLAGKEMEVGRYYLNRGYVNAAINRFRVVVKNYQTTTHVPEALHRLVESYLTLGLKSEATRVAAVLSYNYPGNRWYESSYKLLGTSPEEAEALVDDRSWMDRTIDSLFKPD
jgi:outer membrane protein assembly factor BamD